MKFSTHRQNRCQAILVALPSHQSAQQGKSMRELLALLSSYYADCKSEQAKVRALQSDLKHLREENEITCITLEGEGTTLRYRRAAVQPPVTGNVNLDYLYQDLIQRGIPADLASDFIRRVQHPSTYFDLPPEQCVSVPDTVRLTPIRSQDPIIQQEVLKALRNKQILNASYRNPGTKEATGRRLHPLGIILRDLQHYLIAYDEKDLNQGREVAKMYHMQRLEDAAALTEVARIPSNITVLDLVRNQGLADFVRDTTLVKIKLRIWDYVLRLLEDKQIAPDQTFELEEGGESAIVSASMLQSGTLYRWLLGFGDNVEVLEPDSLRHAVAWEASSVTDYYDDVYDAESDEE